MPSIPRYNQQVGVPLGGQQTPRPNLPDGSDWRLGQAAMGLLGQGVGAYGDYQNHRADRSAETFDETMLDANRERDASGNFKVSAADARANFGKKLRGGALERYMARTQATYERAAGQEGQLRSFTTQSSYIGLSTELDQMVKKETDNLSGAGDGWDTKVNEAVAKRIGEWETSLPADQKAEWSVKADMLYGQVASGTFAARIQQRDKYTMGTLQTQGDGLLTSVRSHPGTLNDGLKNYTDLVGAAPLPASVKEDLLRKAPDAFASASIDGLIDQDPIAAKRAMGGSVTQAGEPDLSGAKGLQANGAKYLKAEGFNGYAVAAILGTATHESGGYKTDAINPGDGRDGSASVGLFQWNAARSKEEKAFAAALGKPWTDHDVQLQFFVKELKRDHPAAYRRLLAADSYEAGVAAMNDFERPRGWTPGGDPTRVDGYESRLKFTKEIGGRALEHGGPAGPVDPLYSKLSYSSLMTKMDRADRKIAENERDSQAAQAKADAEQFNTLMVGIGEGSKGATDIEAAKKAGWLRDYQSINTAETELAQRTKAVAAASGFASAMNAGGALNPFDENNQKGADAYFATTDRSPQSAMNIWQTTGILPKAGANMIRAGLISTDAGAVKRSAAVAGNMLLRNPQAFAGVGEGREDIEKAGIYFNYLVDNLGMTADQASAKVAQRNTPQYKQQAVAKEDDVKTFRAVLTKQGATFGTIDEAIRKGRFGKDYAPGEGAGGVSMGDARQKAAVMSDYNEIALEHFREYGDPGAAQDYALKRMTQLYGVANGALTKYPPTKAYPAVGKGGTDYVYQQAAGDIAARTGDKVEADDVILFPIPQLTAEAWRSGKAPPYMVFYRDRGTDVHPAPRAPATGFANNAEIRPGEHRPGDGYTMKMLPGVVFTADVQRAQAEETARSKAIWDAEQNRRDAEADKLLRGGPPVRAGGY